MPVPEHHGNGRFRWVFIGFVLVAGFFLFIEHRAHVLGVLPYLLLLACPLMHWFMHHGHGHHGDASGKPPSDSADHHRHGG